MQSIRSQSPGNASLASLRQGASSGASQSNYSHVRRKSASVDHHERLNAADSLDRWSKSTDSSKSSAKQRHHRASSGALLDIDNTTSLPSPQRPFAQDASRQSPRLKAQKAIQRPGSRQRPVSPIGNDESDRRPRSRGNQHDVLPSLQAKSLRPAGEALTQSSFSHTQEFFASNNASPRSVVKTARPSTARTSTAPMTSLNYSRLPKAEDVKESAHFRRRSEHITNFDHEAKDARPSTANPSASNEEKKDRPKHKDRSEKEKKAMLAKALEKANTAVVLDNKQNFLGALDAYNDACTLLQQVMDRSVNLADRRKLDAIKVTYTNRIEELKMLEATQLELSTEKLLPPRPRSIDSSSTSPVGSPRSAADVPESASIATMSEAQVVDIPRLAYPDQEQSDFFSKTMADVDRVAHAQAGADVQLGKTRSPTRAHIVNQRVSKLPPPEETSYLPAPLATRKQVSPTSPTYPASVYQEAREEVVPAQDADGNQEPANGTTFLDTIDESSGSSSRSSSVHSKTLESGMRRKALQAHTMQSDPDLDAAFDAAVEAAYDEGLEPDLDTPQEISRPAIIAQASIPSPADIKEILSPTADAFGKRDIALPQTAEDEEEERILDEFSQDYGHGFNFAFGTKSALPRQSDSSGYSRSTWQSSQASERATAGTSLSTVAENDLGHRGIPAGKPPVPNLSPVSPVLLESLPPSAPPPNVALPSPPKPEQLSGSTVRKRRFSGQNAKELKIDTAEQSGRKRASTLHIPHQSYLHPDGYHSDTTKDTTIGAPLVPSPSDAQHERMLKSPVSLDLLSPSRLALTPTDTVRSADDANLASSHELHPGMIRKNQSSLSLRADRALLSPSPGLHEFADPPPLSATFATQRFKGERDYLTSQRAALQSVSSPIANSSVAAGSYLFDAQLLAHRTVHSPRLVGETPAGLEPCPDSLLLRPFWLMRCLASTITHPRGGYVTTKLFVPREVWQTRGVKLKNIDDKVANCDLLTAGLGQLSEVDTFDADAVMDELQRFEEVMERAQTSLVKKLGGDVGVHGVAALFKDAPPPGTGASVVGETDKSADTLSGSTDKNTKSHSGKGYLNSWRKLRSKSSGAPAGHTGPAAYAALKHTSGDKDANAMATVPMTHFVPVERRGQKRDVRNLSFDGPNREYMGSLARLFQAVQVLDQIARQVEDPGLKHSSPTHVGLELSIRHAAEFFSFYVCRFVLADLTTLVDKFVKRGTEWVIT